MSNPVVAPQVREYLDHASRNGGIDTYVAIAKRFGISRERVRQLVKEFEHKQGMKLTRKDSVIQYQEKTITHQTRSPQTIAKYTQRRQGLLQEFGSASLIMHACKRAKVPAGSCRYEVNLLLEANLIQCTRINARRIECIAQDVTAAVPETKGVVSYTVQQRVPRYTPQQINVMRQRTKKWWASLSDAQYEEMVKKMVSSRRKAA